jgi:hypothetical protein
MRFLAARLLIAASVPCTASAAVVYDNGPVAGVNAWTLGLGFALAMSFTLPAPAVLTGAEIGAWTDAGEEIDSVQWGITTMAGSFPVDGTATVANGPVLMNPFGLYDVRLASFALPSVALAAGSYWFVLHTALTKNGYVGYWDVNNGPSIARHNVLGDVTDYWAPGTNSSSFRLLAGGDDPVPAPAALALFGLGVAALGLARRR